MHSQAKAIAKEIAQVLCVNDNLSKHTTILPLISWQGFFVALKSVVKEGVHNWSLPNYPETYIFLDNLV